MMICVQTAASSSQQNEKDVLGEYFLPNETDLHQVIILPKAEWERIQGSTREAAHINEKKEQDEVHLESKANLIQQKLQAKKLREEKEEEERRLIDLEEAKFQAAKRKEAIDRAKAYLSNQDDRMRQFHSALLLTKVLKERDAQVEFLKSRLADNKKRDYEEEQRQFKEYVLSEQEKAHQHYMNRQALCKDQLQQIKEHEHQADLAKQEKKREEEELQRSIQLYQLEIQRKKEKEHKEKLERRKLYHKIIKAIEEQNRMEEDDRIKAHFKAKEIIAQMRKKKEAEMRRQVQEQRDKISSRLAEQMGEALKKEDHRLARDAARREAEEEKKRKEREAKQKAAIESIAEHRATVVRNLGYFCLLQQRSLAQTTAGDSGAIITLLFLFLHQAEKQARKEQEKQAELDYSAQREAIALSKEQEFQKYAKEIIETESKKTHHLYPLLKAWEEGRRLGWPSYLAVAVLLLKKQKYKIMFKLSTKERQRHFQVT
uniref:Trichohyalin-plectin-homology domain-containing protein n=1 Tax=Taeniopygia guttata TaxID=59729 RepID=H0ZC59_TAEGU